MSILLSGDFHANALDELSSITKTALIKKYGRKMFSEINYHIILGDCGFLWPGNREADLVNYRALAHRPFPILCVIGNHEPILGISDVPEVDIGIGEKVLPVNESDPFVAYLKRGKVYKIENKNFLVLGGALSIDREFRQPNKSWWENEYWSEDEKRTLFFTLKKKNKFDYVLSHTGPSRINQTINPWQRVGLLPVFFDEVAALNERIDCQITCRQWFCGHFHKTIYYYDRNLNRGYQYLYKNTALLIDNEIIIGNGNEK
jgi:hypothetical protein